jgi:hypothetical protein
LERNDFDVLPKKNVFKQSSKFDAPGKIRRFFYMQDLLIEHDENIALWRYHHVLMVERMLGMKRGTGGSEGAGYLRTTLSKKIYARTLGSAHAFESESRLIFNVYCSQLTFSIRFPTYQRS